MTSSKIAPGPRGRWLAGNLAQFRNNSLEFLTRCAREYGDVAAFRLGPHRFVLLNHPDFIEQVLVKQNRLFTKHYVMDLLRPTLGNGLLNSEGEFWLRQRRLMQPAFDRRQIEVCGSIMVARAQRLLERWRNRPAIDVHDEMSRLALEIAAEALMGMDVAEHAEGVSHALDVMMEDFSYRFESVFPPAHWWPIPRNFRMWRVIRRLEGVIQTLIQERRDHPRDKADVLSKLVQARDADDQSAMTDRQLRDEVMTLLLAGHETTANALTWTWYLLSQHPQIEEQLHAEVQAVLGDRPPTVEDLPRLRLCEAIVLESMRLYPPVYAVGRRATCDVEIGGFHIRRRTTLLLSQWVTHRDPRWFDRADEFLPDRWLDGRTKNLPKYAYYPFSGGPRVCIGSHFAMLEVQLALATLVQRARLVFEPGKVITPWASVTLRPASAVPAQVVLRGPAENAPPQT